jgi:thiol-disulfide isomerase/thioredoxin
MKPILRLLCLLSPALLSSCTGLDSKQLNPIDPGSVIIRGIIDDYDQSYTSGMLFYFDGLSRQNKQEMIAIDSTGSFITSFNIAHQTSSIYLYLGRYGLAVTAKPHTECQIRIKKDGAVFSGETGELNNELFQIRLALQEAFRDDEQIARQYSESDSTDFYAYYNYRKELSRRKLAFVSEYSEDNQISEEAFMLMKQDISYEPAWASMAFRWTMRDGKSYKREDLPEDLTGIMAKDFPINNPAAVASRTFQDYLTNILDVMREEVIASEALMESLRASGSFTEEEMDIWKGIFSYDGITYGTRAYQELIRDKGDIQEEIFRRENLKKLVEYSARLPKGLGRDFIISQGIMRYCFEIPVMYPGSSDWESINSLLSNQRICEELQRQESLQKANQDAASLTEINVIESLAYVKAEEVLDSLLENYHGKVVYIDFWAPWCGPCREELVFSGAAQTYFKDEEVVFLNLCCRSTRLAWQEFIQAEQITGENYLLDVDEYNYLATRFRISGIPHYMLVDRDGRIRSENAPRPSMEHALYSDIQALLDN